MRIGDPCFTSPHVVLSPADAGGFLRMLVLSHTDTRRLIRFFRIWCRWIPPANDFVWPMVTTRR